MPVEAQGYLMVNMRGRFVHIIIQYMFVSKKRWPDGHPSARSPRVQTWGIFAVHLIVEECVGLDFGMSFDIFRPLVSSGLLGTLVKEA